MGGETSVSEKSVTNDISAAFNEFRINTDGVDVAQWGENYTLSDGGTTPYSITYKDIPYLSLRKIGEFVGKYVAYNGDTKTVYISDAPSQTNIITEKPDSNGNVWEYYTLNTDNGTYLAVRDKKREYERIYFSAGASMRITDNEIYFVKRLSHSGDEYSDPAELVKLSFDCDINSQDGEKIADINVTGGRDVIFDGDYLYYGCYWQSDDNPHDSIIAYNYITGEETVIETGTREKLSEIKLASSDENTAVINYVLERQSIDGNVVQNYDVTFYKNQKMFNKQRLADF